MKEQSLVLSFKKSDDILDLGGIDSNEGLAIKKSFSVLPNDKKNSFFAYEKLSMYVHGAPDDVGADWVANDSSLVELLFRFGKDNQYYEIRQPIFEGWNNQNHIEINIDNLTQYKLEISLEEYEDVGIDGCSNISENGLIECLEDINQYLKYIEDQDITLNTIETVKEEIENNYFKSEEEIENENKINIEKNIAAE